MGPRKQDIEDAKSNKIEKQGMVYDRSCTDVICCLVFCLFFACMGAISIYAIGTGNPWKILTPYDSDGNRCGFPDQEATPGLGKRDFTEYKYKFYTDLDVVLNQAAPLAGANNMYTAICVKECPTFDSGAIPSTLSLEYMQTSTNPKT